MVGIAPLLSESDQCSITGLEVCDNSNPSHVSYVPEREKYILVQYSTAWLYFLHEAYLLVVCSKFTPQTQ